MSDFYKRALAANGDYGTLALDGALTEELLAILARDADVRTLDDWVEAEGVKAQHRTRRNRDALHASTAPWVCSLADAYECGMPFYGATPDEARAKAAAWVREQKP